MKKLFSVLMVMAALLMVGQSVFACTIFGVGKDAMVDGSTVVTHNDDSSGADFRLWIIPEMKGGEGEVRDLVVDSHNYGDYGNYPEVKDYGKGYVVNQIPQPEDTYAYMHSRYSFMNEVGVATSESTNSIGGNTPAYKALFGNNSGVIDCWNAQDIALERASTAREAVRVMGDLVETYGWGDPSESILVCDGNEVWLAEFYGMDVWCAVRIPDNAFTVTANRARINYIDFNDSENYMYSPNIKSFAVENGLWKESDGEFSPAKAYAPSDSLYSTRREWIAFKTVCPSMDLDPNSTEFPLYVVPEKKLTVDDIFDLAGNYYQGTEFDQSLTPQAGPFGNVAAYDLPERTINLFRTCYVMIANVKAWLPEPIRCLVWYGYGAPDSTFITPLWASMAELPEFYRTGNRYEEFRRDSGWWVASWVQQLATMNYAYVIQQIEALRDPKLDSLYKQVEQMQTVAARLYNTGAKQEAMQFLSDFAYWTAVGWQADWVNLGDQLTGDLAWSSMNRVNMKSVAQPQWWKDIMSASPRKE